jgi:hypothetical protein
MQVTGHNSYGTQLGWFADRSESVLPIGFVAEFRTGSLAAVGLEVL